MYQEKRNDTVGIGLFLLVTIFGVPPLNAQLVPGPVLDVDDPVNVPSSLATLEHGYGLNKTLKTAISGGTLLLAWSEADRLLGARFDVESGARLSPEIVTISKNAVPGGSLFYLTAMGDDFMVVWSEDDRSLHGRVVPSAEGILPEAPISLGQLVAPPLEDGWVPGYDEVWVTATHCSMSICEIVWDHRMTRIYLDPADNTSMPSVRSEYYYSSVDAATGDANDPMLLDGIDPVPSNARLEDGAITYLAPVSIPRENTVPDRRIAGTVLAVSTQKTKEVVQHRHSRFPGPGLRHGLQRNALPGVMDLRREGVYRADL